MDFILKLFEKMRPLHGPKDTNIASIVGFVFGGIGLAIYFRSFVDLLFPLLVVILATATVGELGLLFGAVVAGMYGYFRASASNQQLESMAAGVVASPVGAPVAHP